MTEREKHLLWIVLQIHCFRYIMYNSEGSYNGAGKAREHIIISKLLAHFIEADGGCWTIRGIDEEWPRGWENIHDWSETYITDILDVSIGFPVGKKLTQKEIGEFSYKLFERLCEYLPVFEEKVKSSDDTSHGLNNG